MSEEELVYGLVPGVYRDRDLQVGQPLRAYVGVIDAAYRRLFDAIGEGYDDWFIETCRPWAIAYIGDLLGLPRSLYEPDLVDAHRALVGNTMRRRRAKGTPGALAGAYEDATGAPTRVVTGLESAAFDQNVAAVRSAAGRLIDVRDALALACLGGPFDRAARTATTRVPAVRTGPGGLPAFDVRPRAATLFACRLRSYRLHAVQARAEGGIRGAFTFDPAGLDVPLFAPPPADAADLTPEDPARYPGPLPPGLLALELAARRAGASPPSRFFGPDPALRIYVSRRDPAALREVAPDQLAIADLSDWGEPRLVPVAAPTAPAATVWLDPGRGRLLFTRAFGAPPKAVVSSYAYGLAQDIGAGPYLRGPRARASATWEMRVGSVPPLATLADALEAWRQAAAATPERLQARIVITDDGTFPLGLGGPLELRGGSLAIEAVEGVRPCVVGSAAVRGRGTFRLEGVLLTGGLECGGDVDLRLCCSTLLPGKGPVLEEGRRRTRCSVIVQGGQGLGSVEVTRSIVGRLAIGAGQAVSLSRAVVDGNGEEALLGLGKAPAPPTSFDRCTVLGSARVDAVVDALDSIFLGPLLARRTSSGQVRCCWLAAGSVVPLSISAYGPPGDGDGPRFVSLRYGDAGYAQLDLASPAVVLHGANQRGQLGAMNGAACERSSLEAWVLDEYLRAGFSANIVYVT